ncbi:MAG: GWxTD domain-containing protein [Bacteroidetes bacterium]|nr:GWxTD domain-containing protein [Bacteroidota bacterium]
MKRIIMFASLLFAVGNSFAREITANLSCCAFSTADSKSYVETYISIIGNSVTYNKKPNGKYSAAVDVVMTFNSNDSIRSAQRYILNSPEVDDSSKAVNFLDLQRIPLPAGYYYLQVSLTDLNRQPQHPISNKRSILVSIDQDSVNLSDVELLDNYYKSTTHGLLTKSGYDLVPYGSSFYPPNLSQLSFYSEIYNTSKVLKPEEKFLVLYYIESAVNGNKMSGFSSFIKPTPEKVIPLLFSFNVTSLPSGSYYLVVEVRNASNRLLSMHKTSFERFNPGVIYKLDDLAAIDIANTFAGKIKNGDSLVDVIRSLRPISSSSEIEFAENRIKAGDIKLMQQYLYNFWLARNEPNPQAAWDKYNSEVQRVNKEFGTQIMKGYDSDRGRVYLQYGPPDQRVVMNEEPSAYPYEIWQYYSIRNNPNISEINQPDNVTQTNKKFVFADFDLVTNKYQLIHSDARGETRDDNWKLRLVKRDNATHSLDQQNGNPQYGGHSNDWYTNPH